jgi:hypothetical protein
VDNLPLHTPRVELVLRDMKRVNSFNKKKKTWLPITPCELQLLKREWSTKPISTDRLMLWAAACIGFFGFLRCPEFTAPSASCSTQGHMFACRMSQPTAWMGQCRQSQSKTDQFGKGVNVFLDGRVPSCSQYQRSWHT